VAEQWGRRWITCDSSRVALALAKHRLLTAKFDYQRLRPLSAEDVARNPQRNVADRPDAARLPARPPLQCRTVPHITLKSIARNTSLDPIFAKYEPILAERLALLNGEVVQVGAALKDKLLGKLIQKHREQGANTVTDADIAPLAVARHTAGADQVRSGAQTVERGDAEAGPGLPRCDTQRRLEANGKFPSIQIPTGRSPCRRR
jgi:hypothetical protein